MSTKLKAGTSTSGAVIDADTTGILELQSGSTPTTAVTIDASQNVGIGTTPSSALSVFRGTGVNAFVEISGGGNTLGSASMLVGQDNGSTGYLYNRATAPVVFGTANTERMRIDSSGNLLVGTTSVGSFGTSVGASITSGRGLFSANANSALAITRLSSTGNLLDMYYGLGYVGSISTNGSTITYGGTSDYRLKENVRPLTNALDSVSRLKPCEFTWKATGIEDNGFIAHELAEVCPNAVVGEKDAVNEDGSIKPQQIDTSFLVATLTAAIQELNAKVEALEAQLGAK